MSRKIIAASIVLVMFGGVSTSGGFFVNDFIDTLVTDQMDVALLEIKAQAQPIVEEIVNETLVANLIKIDIFGLAGVGDGVGEARFFNDSTAEALGQCIASYNALGDLNYTVETRYKLLYGDTSLGLPGLISNLETGSGVSDFLDLYDKTSSKNDLRIELASKYSCSWELIKNVANWINDYALPFVVPQLATIAYLEKPELKGLDTTKKIASFYFKAQWANASLIGDPGFPLPLGFMDLYGFEAGLPVATNLSVQQIDRLWDTKNEYSLLNKKGLQRWFSLINHPDYPIVNSLKKFNGNLSDHATGCILSWLQNFKQNLMPYLAQYQMNLPTDSTTLGNAIQIGGIAIGGLTLGLAVLGLTGTVIRTKKLKNVKKIRVPTRSGSSVFLGGLPKRYSRDLGQAIGEIPSEDETHVDKNFKFKKTS